MYLPEKLVDEKKAQHLLHTGRNHALSPLAKSPVDRASIVQEPWFGKLATNCGQE